MSQSSPHPSGNTKNLILWKRYDGLKGSVAKSMSPEEATVECEKLERAWGGAITFTTLAGRAMNSGWSAQDLCEIMNTTANPETRAMARAELLRMADDPTTRVNGRIFIDDKGWWSLVELQEWAAPLERNP